MSRILGRHRFACECIFQSYLRWNTLGQTHQTARACNQTTSHLRNAKLCIVCRHNQVAGQRNFAASGQGVAFYSSNQRFQGRTLCNPCQSASLQLNALALQESLQVHTSAKMATTARQNANRKTGVTVQYVHRCSNGFGRGAVDGIAHGRTIDGDDHYGAFAINEHAGRQLRQKR